VTMTGGMLNLDEVKHFLELEEEAINALVQEGKLTAYKIGGVYLRFSKTQVSRIRQTQPPRAHPGRSFLDRFIDFWHAYAFYIFTSIAVGAVLYAWVKYG